MKQKKLLSLLLALAMTLSLSVPAMAADDKYAGIESGKWYEAAARYAVDNGIMTGTNQGFAPTGTVTRATIVQILYNLEGRPAVDFSKVAMTNESDVAGQWYSDAAHWVMLTGIVPQGAFLGDEVVTRAEVAQLLMNYAQLHDITSEAGGMALQEAPDYDQIPLAFLDGVSFCYYTGVMTGDETGRVNPTGGLTRAELAMTMMNYAEFVASAVKTYTTETVTIDVPEQDGIPAHTIPAVLTLPEGEGKHPAVVMLHGTGSNKDEAGNGYAMAAPGLATSGIVSIRIDFMGSGDSTAAYTDYNYTSANIDAKAAADYLAGLPQVDAKKLAVWGWSQGGANALLAAAAYPETFQAVVTWAGAPGMGDAADFESRYTTAKKDGYYEQTYDWRDPLKVGVRWFEEVKNTDVLKEIAKITGPILAVQGMGDTVVLPENADKIVAASKNEQSSAYFIENCDHTFNVFSGDYTAIAAATNAGIGFLEQTLNGALESATAVSISKYGNVTTDMPIATLTGAGYAPGDILKVTVGTKTISVPYGDAYSNVDNGKEVLVPDKESGCATLAVNMGSFAKTYSVEVGTEMQLAMDTKAGYLEEYEIRNIDSKRTNERTDYASDEIFANFRPVEMGELAEGVLYRSSSPANNELGRAATADKLIKAAGVATVMNLADAKEELEGYFTAEGFASPFYKGLYDGENVIYLNMGVDFTAPEFAAGLKTGFEFLIANKGPYLIHCNEGKDRAGFTVALLEALMGGQLAEIQEDYMLSYINYYHVEKDSDQYKKIAESNILNSLAMISGLEKGADLSKVDLQKAAEDYLTKTVGLTAEQVTALKTALSTPTAAEKAA